MKIQSILERISQRIDKLGTSEQAVSLAAGASKDLLRNWRRRVENGESSAGVNAESLLNVAKALDVSIFWLMEGSELSADDEMLQELLKVWPRLSQQQREFLVASARGVADSKS